MDSPTAVVIETDPAAMFLISTVLQQEGFTVHGAHTGPAGVITAFDISPDLVITDLALPGFDGQEVIRRIRLFSDVPLLILCASNDLRDLQTGLGAGADSYLRKPCSAEKLRAIINALQRRPPWLARP